METIQGLLKACRIGDLESLKQILEVSPELIDAAESSLGWTGLYCSVLCGHYEISKFLIKNNANVNIKTRMGETPLHQAVECKNLKLCKLLLKHGADLNIQQNDGETPLHIAVVKNNYKCVCLLLENNADCNIQNYIYGKTPLHYASEDENDKIYKEILKYSPNMSIKDKSGNTAKDLRNSIKDSKDDITITVTPISGEPVEGACLSQQLSPSYTRCNSDVSLLAENRSIDNKLRQCEMMHKKIRETVRSSVETIKRLDHSSNSLQEMDTERTVIEEKPGEKLKPDLNRWLKTLRLDSEAEILTKAGYDDLAQLVKQMRTTMPLTEKSLRRIGMTKPGHRKRMLVSLESLALQNNAGGLFSQIQCCLSFPRNIWFNNMSSLEQWLDDLCLRDFADTLRNAGFEEVEDLIILAGTSYAIDDGVLIEIGIDKPGYRERILAKIRESCGGSKIEEIAIDRNSNNTACELCEIM